MNVHIVYNFMKTGDEGKDCFFSYHAKAELPPWIFFFYAHVLLSYPMLVIILLQNFFTAPITNYLEQNLTNSQSPEITVFTYYLAEYCSVSISCLGSFGFLMLHLCVLYLFYFLMCFYLFWSLVFQFVSSSVTLISTV